MTEDVMVFANNLNFIFVPTLGLQYSPVLRLPRPHVFKAESGTISVLKSDTTRKL